MDPTSNPCLSKNSATRVASFLYNANTNTFSRSFPTPPPFFTPPFVNPWSRRTPRRRCSFSRPSARTMADCSTRELAVSSSAPTVMRMGEHMKSDASLRTVVGHVAENMQVCEREQR